MKKYLTLLLLAVVSAAAGAGGQPVSSGEVHKS